jgi:hypothetical protein
MLSQKSILARLLANENIIVQQGNYETAFFDVKTRMLGLPLWKDMGKDIYDMLVGHEVSHALFTPVNFNKYPGTDDIPHSWLNIVEDVRIEKLILRKYPGLVANFKRAYHQLFFDLDLFGIKEKDVSTLGFMDRLNVKAKARDLVEVPFAKDELPYVDMAMACETYDDVVTTCQEIQKFLKEKQERGDNSSEGEGGEDEGQGKTITVGIITDNVGDEGEASDVTPDIIIDMRENKDDESDEESEDDGEDAATGDDTDSGDESENSDSEVSATEPQSGLCDEEALTDVNYNQNQSKLLEGSSKLYVEGITKAQADAHTVPYHKIAAARKIAINGVNNSFYRTQKLEFPESDYKDFLSETKRVVNLMVKEFEMRKAAHRTLRARTSTKGSLDVNKIHRYRYEDNLFKQVTHLADAKNHGMVMLLDYSGSMHNMLPSVIKQTLALIMFCKRVGIPFEVYSFTSVGGDDSWMETRTKIHSAKPSVTSVDCREMGLLELFNSEMGKRDYEEAFRMMFWQTVNSRVSSVYETLGNTPLNASLMAMGHKIDAFRKKYQVEKMTFITLTDGDSNPLNPNRGVDISGQGRIAREYVVNVRGNKVDCNGVYGRDVTAKFIKEIEKTGVTTVNYFVCNSHYDFNSEIIRSVDTSRDLRAYKSELSKNGCVVLDDNMGYMRRFILVNKTNAMQGKLDDFEVDDNMTTRKIASEFKKASDSKKKSRVVTQKFAELVA